MSLGCREEAINCEEAILGGPSLVEFGRNSSRPSRETTAFSRPLAKDTAAIPDSSSKNQKAEATQQPGSEIFVDGGQQFPRKFQKHLAWRRTKLDRTGRVEVIQHFIAGILQCPQCRLFAEIVKVRIHLTPFEEPILAEYRLHGKVQRDVKYLVAAPRLHSLQETEIVRQMLDHIQDNDQIKEFIRLLPEVGKLEVDLPFGSSLGQLDGLWGDVVAPEDTLPD